jgi:hypothetical protein
MMKESIQAIVYFVLTSSFRGFGGGGNVDLSSFRPLALSAPLEDLGFFPILLLKFTDGGFGSFLFRFNSSLSLT